MAANSLNDFIDQFKGGNRTHRYEVVMGFPSGVPSNNDEDLTRFFVRAVSLPPSQVNPIRIPYRGRILKWPGDRVFFPWTIRILDQNDGANKSLWNDFNEWSNYINDYKHNTTNDNFDNFVTDWEIIQTDAQGDDVKTVKLVGCWPTIVGPISMDANAIDTLVEFTVTVEYQWAEVKGVNY
jgi:hypothetical protein